MLGIVAWASGYCYGLYDLQVYEVSMTAPAAAINEACFLKLRDQFPYLRWHCDIPFDFAA